MVLADVKNRAVGTWLGVQSLRLRLPVQEA